MNMMTTNIFSQVKQASRRIAWLSDDERNEVLLAVADAIVKEQETLLEANSHDLNRMDRSNPLYDRLQLTPDRLQAIAADMRKVASLP